MRCDRCNGKGIVIIYKNSTYKIYELCYKCGGNKKIDWVSKIFEEEQSDIPKFIVDPWSFINKFVSNKRLDYIFKKYNKTENKVNIEKIIVI